MSDRRIHDEAHIKLRGKIDQLNHEKDQLKIELNCATDLLSKYCEVLKKFNRR